MTAQNPVLGLPYGAKFPLRGAQSPSLPVTKSPSHAVPTSNIMLYNP